MVSPINSQSRQNCFKKVKFIKKNVSLRKSIFMYKHQMFYFPVIDPIYRRDQQLSMSRPEGTGNMGKQTFPMPQVEVSK